MDHIERRTAWIAKQRLRNPSIPAFTELLRLSRMPENSAKKTSKTISKKKVETLDTRIWLGHNERVERKRLFEIEKIVLNQGVESAALELSTEHPYLAELLMSKETFEVFVTTQPIKAPWNKTLRQLMHVNPELRAIGLLLYLRKTHRNKIEPVLVRSYQNPAVA